MEQKSLARMLKIIIIGAALCGLVIFFLIIPELGKSMVYNYPEFECRFWPWLIFLWIVGIPCYVALFFGWKIACNIGRDNSFSYENAKYLKYISWLFAGDVMFFFVGNVVLLFANMSHPGVVLLSLLVAFFGVAISIAAAALSHLVNKAAKLQEESDLTV